MSDESDSVKEARIRAVALAYYSRKDVEKAIYDFCRGRETVPKYFEGFGKRPNTLEYPNEILALVKNGATSFHCSEERWKDVLGISMDKNLDDFNDLRDGWDLLIDIDSKYFEYAKQAAISVINVLENNGVKNFGVKFSGGKGFHIIVPWEAFPKELNGVDTSRKFPEIPRIILGYIMEEAKPLLEKALKDDETLKKVARGIRCESCKNIANESYLIVLECPNPRCRTSEEIKKTVKEVDSQNTDSSFKIGKKRKCTQCSTPMVESSKTKIYYCDNCKIDSRISKENFSSIPMYDIYEQLGLDVILVSPRHLFRSPYSLHEKTSLASVVIDKSQITNFSHKDADPIRVTIKNFLPSALPNEAKNLLIKSYDWFSKKKISNKSSKDQDDSSSFDGEKKFKEIVIDRSKLKYAPVIDEILKGIKGDGRKRALFILINYFKSLNFSEDEIKRIVVEWDAKNSKPLREGYVNSQLSWSFKQKKLLPPNYDKPHYKGIGINPTDEELKFKNPVSYTIKKMFSHSRGKDYK